MEYTGCGSKDHFYKEFKIPNKAELREKRLTRIQSLRRQDCKKHIRSYFMQLSDTEEDSDPDFESEGDNANL